MFTATPAPTVTPQTFPTPINTATALPTATPYTAYDTNQDEGTPTTAWRIWNCIGDLIACTTDVVNSRTNLTITNPTPLPTPTLVPTATPIPAVATPTPLVFGTPGVISVFAATELGAYAGNACPTPGVGISISAAGALGCATPVPTATLVPVVPTPTPPATPVPTATAVPVVATPAITSNTLAKGTFLQNSAITDDGAGAIGIYPAAAAPQAVTETFASATGTDHAGANEVIKLSGSTGTGLGGNIAWQNTNKAGTGSTANTYGNVLTLSPPNTGTSAPVNYVDIKNAITGSGPTIASTGSDAAVPLTITPKSTGALTLTTAGNTTINSGNNQLFLQVAGTTIVSVIATALRGQTDNTYDLGTTTLRWRDFFLGRHINTAGSTAPTVGTCGTSPSITGFDTAGQVTTGSSATTACTITFGVAFVAAPTCVITDANGSITPAAFSVGTVSTSSVIINYASATSTKFNFICIGH
jgi:hypothetical protein